MYSSRSSVGNSTRLYISHVILLPTVLLALFDPENYRKPTYLIMLTIIIILGFMEQVVSLIRPRIVLQ